MSGEALMGRREFGHDREILHRLGEDVAAVARLGTELCIVIGGGNMIRGSTLAAAGVERTSADYMGMLGTVINALAVQSVIEQAGIPIFTTDTAAALRAAEMGCDAILKGTQVDGVYSADPKRHPDARRFDRLSFLDVLSKDLKVMDASAIALARESNIPIIVFSLHAENALARVLRGEGPHTIITEEAGA